MKKVFFAFLFLFMCIFTGCGSAGDLFDTDSTAVSDTVNGSDENGNGDNDQNSDDEMPSEGASLVLEPQSSFCVAVYTGMDIKFYVDETGSIVYTEVFLDETGSFENVDFVGLSFEEGMPRMLDVMCENSLFSGVTDLSFEFVVHENVDWSWFENSVQIPVSDYLVTKGISDVNVSVGYYVYLKELSSPAYAFYEEHYPKHYSEIKDKFAYYDELARTGENKDEYDRRLEKSRNEGMPFEIILTSDGSEVMLFYNESGKLRSISLSGEQMLIDIRMVSGTEMYKTRCVAYCEGESALFWPDGKVETFYGDGADKVRIEGANEVGYIYLPEAKDLNGYDEAMSLLEQYADDGVLIENDSENLSINWGGGYLYIKHYLWENQLEIRKYSKDWNEFEETVYINQQFYAHTKQINDDELGTLYSFYETEKEIRETFYDHDACRTTTTTFDKASDETMTNISKMVKSGPSAGGYYIRWENHLFINEYEYIDESSHILKAFISTDKSTGEVFYWELDGKELDDKVTTNHVVSLTRTLNGVSKTYSVDEIPWGSGMVYPPNFTHEYGQRKETGE